MPIPQEYIGREQTFAKHIFLEKYLERLSYNILSFRDEFVYVDGFSGPWESKGDSYADTSFAIALKKLAEVKKGAESAFGKPKKISCLFIEKDPKVFAELDAFAKNNKPEGIEIQVINGDFENLIGDIQKFVGKSFAFIFIDPTGWTGYAYEKIKPLFQQKGEFLINFMYNYINRFIEDQRDNIKAGFNDLFGAGNWEAELGASYASMDFMTQERTVVELYCKKLRSISNTLKWAVTYTPISHPVKDRSWFYLIYATTHVKGLKEFHKAEDSLLEEYGEIRKEALHIKKTSRSGQAELFGHEVETPKALPLELTKHESEKKGQEMLLNLLKASKRLTYSALAFEILQIPLVNEKLFKTWLNEMRSKGLIVAEGLQPKEHPKDTTVIALVTE